MKNIVVVDISSPDYNKRIDHVYCHDIAQQNILTDTIDGAMYFLGIFGLDICIWVVVRPCRSA